MSMNTSEMTRTLEAAGIQEEQAKALAEVIQKGREDLSTKADLEAATGKLGSAIVEVRTGLEGSMESLKGDIEVNRTSLEGDIKRNRTSLEGSMKSLKGDIKRNRIRRVTSRGIGRDIERNRISLEGDIERIREHDIGMINNEEYGLPWLHKWMLRLQFIVLAPIAMVVGALGGTLIAMAVETMFFRAA